MAEPSKRGLRRVLHVHPPSLDTSKEVALAIADADCQEVPCPDVYRALARLGGGNPSDFLAVVVCVDRTEAGEFEFFQLVDRHCRDVRVYVYGRPHAQSNVEAALRHGARQAVEPAELARILRPSSVIGPAPQPTVKPARTGDVDAPKSDAAPAEAPTAIEEQPGDPDSAPQPAAKPKKKRASSARVPWLRYDDAPRRTPPKQAAPEIAEPSQPPDEADVPLLSPEELEALMQDEEGDASTSRGSKRRRRL